ncbi:MAG: hypothetical protein NPIRA03_26840 [Nitrospirales bacterium]|nr:MAG: hypothetical protein NPIRA03_26840 [Nitrospirales bacterium]
MTLSLKGIIFFAVLLSGCAGYDRVLFVTKTNVGLDIDTEPPTAEITIARRELAIQPTFSNVEKESGLSLLAAFGLTGNFFNPSITAHFAGGDAAVYLIPGDETNPVNSGLCLSQEPQDPRGLLLRFWHYITGQEYKNVKDEPRPFYFATDTSYGVKVAWSGTAGPYPDSLKLGYNRKEFASPPIYIDSEGSCTIEEDTGKGSPGYKVTMPSFYAAIDNAGGFTTVTESGVKHVQFFATGEAATRFAKDPYVQKIAYSQMAPSAATLKADELGLNEALIKEIEEAFKKSNAEKKTEIMEAAKILKVVDEDEITSSSFVGKLKKYSDASGPEVSTNLIIVRRVAVAQSEKPAVPVESPTQ